MEISGMGEKTEPGAHRICRREREVIVCRQEELANNWMIATIIVSLRMRKVSMFALMDRYRKAAPLRYKKKIRIS